MKRFFTTLIILLVVIAAGLAALILLVNPNDFRDYIVNKVKEDTGYELVMKDDMRWHVWPKLSIITGKMSLTAPDAAEPVVTAENMRLDVELWPLLSHQLSVREVMLDGALLKILPETESKEKKSAPVAPGNQKARPVPVEQENKWSFDVDRIRIANSLLVWQTEDGSQINMRDINFSLERNTPERYVIALNSNILRNQQELSFSLSSDIDLSQYPVQVSGNINRLNYRLSGAGLYANGINGNGTTTYTWHEAVGQAPQSLILENLKLSANESQLSGTVEAALGETPRYDIQLTSSKLNLDNLLGYERAVHAENGEKTPVATKPAVVTTGSDADKYDLTFMNHFNATLALNVDSLIYQGMEIGQLTVKAENRGSITEISKMTGNVFGGRFSLPMTIYSEKVPAQLRIKPLLQNIDVKPLLAAFKMPEKFTGRLSFDGDLRGTGYDQDAVLNNWRGDVALTITDVKLLGLNIPYLIQQSLSQATDKVAQPESMDAMTEAKKLEAIGTLNNGEVKISKILAVSDAFNITGSGRTNLVKQNLDVNLGVQILKGWGKTNDLVTWLQSVRIPVVLFGNWDNIQYKFEVENLLRNQIQQRVKQAAGELLNEKTGKDLKAVESLLNRL
ncbi:outer membrane assembly protein AsmA [Morganella morganii]|uniref:outer membrane assembly protein AsmA n=1 Tax=Morganella morganii TaxID=582 RepID=UPI0003A6D035|nr:outer membrane assembly protein AsmA [Morganella morganii]MBC3995710.1 outer membrane assembly protein AsmA [Morganella morganii]MBS5195180.1 outer membrane assembly protein AsmA [Morganella morganii]HDU8580912.1 outer membrane assembly protein AsmA [Morganella morganii]